MKRRSLSVGDLVEVTAERLAYGGEAVARSEGLAIFIPFAAPGERLRVRITERKKSFARGVIEEILVRSPERREPPCRYFGECGGCQLQHLNYGEQLKAKSGFVRDALRRIGRIDWDREIEIRAPAEFGYRSRAQLKAEYRLGGLRIGFNRTASHTVCDVDACPVLVPELGRALDLLRSTLKSGDKDALPPVIDIATGQTGLGVEPAIAGFAGGPVTQRVGEIEYRFAPSTFFQVNSLLLEEFVREATANQRGRLAIDLYAGVGLFTLQLARTFDRVIGIESDPRAAQFARRNVSVNNMTNVGFHNDLVEGWLRRYEPQQTETPDLILLDPPRAGAAEALSEIVRLRPSRITYVSCDPATLARDLRTLLDAGYGLSDVVAFDLFPQTFHVETIARLALNGD